MMGVRLEMRGLLYTGPRTILHNLRKTVERVGIHVDNVIISPLAIVNSVLNEGEREFGATVIDMGGGQTTVATIRNQELQFTNIYQEGGEYVTKDISKVLKTSQKIAESLKLNYGEAYVPLASNETFQVEVIGEVEPVEVTESYLAEIISARIKHIFDQIKQELDRRHLLDLPGGIVLIGGNAILPGVVELAQEVFGVRVKLYVPNQVGIRNPAFAHVISLSEFAGKLTEVNLLAQKAVRGDEFLRQKPINFGVSNQSVTPIIQSTPVQPATAATEIAPDSGLAPRDEFQASSQDKPKLTDRFRSLIGSMFDE
jgi:cell division protein ftsA